MFHIAQMSVSGGPDTSIHHIWACLFSVELGDDLFGSSLCISFVWRHEEQSERLVDKLKASRSLADDTISTRPFVFLGGRRMVVTCVYAKRVDCLPTSHVHQCQQLVAVGCRRACWTMIPLLLLLVTHPF